MARAIADISEQFRGLSDNEKAAAADSACSSTRVLDAAGCVVGASLTDAEASFFIWTLHRDMALANRSPLTERDPSSPTLPIARAPSPPRTFLRPGSIVPGAMSGTPKQVAWAAQIRAERWSRIEGYIATRCSEPGLDPLLADCYGAALKVLAHSIPAKWWIEHREESIAQAVDGVARRLYAQRTPQRHWARSPRPWSKPWIGGQARCRAARHRVEASSRGVSAIASWTTNERPAVPAIRPSLRPRSRLPSGSESEARVPSESTASARASFRTGPSRRCRPRPSTSGASEGRASPRLREPRLRVR